MGNLFMKAERRALASVVSKVGRLAERTLARGKYTLWKKDVLAKVSATLPAISVELTNICNANCIFCAYQYMKRPKGLMSMDLFRKVVEQLVECGGGDLLLSSLAGDPLVDRHLLERIAYARSKPEIQSIELFTNMINLHRHGADEFVRSGISSVHVSTSGLDEAMYRRLYRSNQYHHVVTNIKQFVLANNAAGRPVKIDIALRFDRPVKEVFGYPDHKDVEQLVGAENITWNLFFDSWNGRIRQEHLTGTMKLVPRSSMALVISPCAQLYRGPLVCWDGRVSACGCRDIDADALIIGDVTKRHLGKIWFGEELARLRQEFLTDKIPPICVGCTGYRDMSVFLTRNSRRHLKAKPSPFCTCSTATL